MRRLRRLALENFRSYTAESIVLGGRAAAFVGLNGAGKTNLLEALSLLGPGRGMRRAPSVDLARQDGPGGWGVGADIGGTEGDVTTLTIRVEPQAPGRKVVAVDGVTCTVNSLLDHARFMWLTPAQDRLFTDSPGERRRFLDRLVLGAEAGHGASVLRYEHAQRQRQAALLAGGDMRVVASFEREMAVEGELILAARARTVARLSAGMAQVTGDVFPAARLALDFGPSLDPGDPPSAEGLGQAIAASRQRDLEAGRALVGAHRGDLLVRHADKDQPAALCSTGEQKALLIGLVLAHAATLRTGIEGPTILLLDEVAAHLDPGRRAALADILCTAPVQPFMTGTEALLFEAWAGRADLFEVTPGVVSPLG